ncbi:MAG: hypothetical protein IIW22_00175, partial [Erysipelotrichaceae bacterium]|nr:hypothetical protein [Erysipelotrichaceae bacterium]
MKKRISAILLIVCMLVSMLAMTACGTPKGKSNFAVPEVGYDGSAVEISFYNTMGTNLQTVFNAYLEEFNKL